MRYFSTNQASPPASFEEAVKKGLPSDKGLFMPESIQVLPDEFFNTLPGLSLPEIGYHVIKSFVGNEIGDKDLRLLIEDALDFEIPLVQVEEGVFSLELFHGPTLAFKDVGARFMARCLGYFNRQHSERVTVLVATSGDTGSAVANGFLGVDNVDVVILYPKGQVSDFQEKQMTTLGQNIKALEVDGSFDDCQKLVKAAFLDNSLTQKLGLTSANSINIARLLPQSFYYFYAYGKVKDLLNKPLVFSVPSGNYGNLTAGILAKRMGLPVEHFIAASNINDIVPHYIRTGNYKPRMSEQTISNAMDVGDPSNYTRLNYLFEGNHSEFKKEISGFSFTDEETKDAIRHLQTLEYSADPHGAVGYLGLKDYQETHDVTGIFLETAHPVKFKEVVEPVTGVELEVPASMVHFLERPKMTVSCPAEYEEFKSILLEIL